MQHEVKWMRGGAESRDNATIRRDVFHAWEQSVHVDSYCYGKFLADHDTHSPCVYDDVTGNAAFHVQYKGIVVEVHSRGSGGGNVDGRIN